MDYKGGGRELVSGERIFTEACWRKEKILALTLRLLWGSIGQTFWLPNNIINSR